MAPNFYEVLGIEKDAPQDEVRKAYKRRALETHPDKTAPLTTQEVKESAAARFRDVHEAFKVLNDPYQRRAYDTSLIRPNLPRSEKSWVQLDEEQIARMKDREEWAKQFAQRRKDRLNALDQARKVRESQRKARCEEKGLDYEQLKDMYLEELCRLNPEWQARKEQAHRRKEQVQAQANSTRTS